MVSKNNNLKAFIRLDSNYQIVPSSLILQKNKPVVGKWEEININQCCNYVPTTTTTSTSTTSTTTTTTLLPYFCALGDITIGTQIWTGCNLNVDTYRNGDPIPQVTDNAEWDTLTTGAWCYYNNDPVNGTIYGKLYNRYAVMDPRGLAPAGYHIPSESEWTTLINFLGGVSLAGGKMKEIGTTHWLSPNFAATNSSGFTGLPGSNRQDNGIFSGIGLYGTWWSSSSFNSVLFKSYDLRYHSSDIILSAIGAQAGAQVRLIKD
jgi:uncharacterized protein (TIGR02145 family)